jgi:hypothetical protein
MYGPFAVVDESVVVAAEEDAVVEAGFTPVYPVLYVVGEAPAWWPSTAGEGAALVSYDQGSADGGGDEASFPSDVEDLAGSGEYDGEHFGVADIPCRFLSSGGLLVFFGLGPCGGFVVPGVGLEATVQDSDEAVAELA